jgi:hypothetical protein
MDAWLKFSLGFGALMLGTAAVKFFSTDWPAADYEDDEDEPEEDGSIRLRSSKSVIR